MSTSTVATPYRMFDARVRRLEQVAATMLRVTFTGPDLDRFADPGLDTRIKVVLPLPEVGYRYLDRSGDWYAMWRSLEEWQRNPIRTYTTRLVRGDDAEVDIDFVLHGDTGPASAWASSAKVGDEVVLIGPNADHAGPYGGYEFAPHPGTRAVLVAGDETALPAIARILEDLAVTDPQVVGDAVIEVPTGGDTMDLVAPSGIRVSWLVRDGAEHGERLVSAVREAAANRMADAVIGSDVDLADVDIDETILWEIPDAGPDARPDTERSSFYAWLAGEAGAIKNLRRYLVRDLGVDRSQVAFMGYWRIGRAEN